MRGEQRRHLSGYSLDTALLISQLRQKAGEGEAGLTLPLVSTQPALWQLSAGPPRLPLELRGLAKG